MQVLSKTDKDTIDKQKKKMNVIRTELEHYKFNYKTLKKTYEEVSLHVAKNATDMEKVKKMREDYEK